MSGRRGFLAGAAAMAGAGGLARYSLLTMPPALAASSPDAELIAHCAEFVGLEHRISGLYDTIRDDRQRDRVIEPMSDAQALLVDRICALRATTLEGHRARAEALALWASDLLETDEEYWDDRLLAAMLRDLAAGVA